MTEAERIRMRHLIDMEVLGRGATKAGFDPRQVRDPHTGEWVDMPGLDVAGEIARLARAETGRPHPGSSVAPTLKEILDVPSGDILSLPPEQRVAALAKKDVEGLVHDGKVTVYRAMPADTPSEIRPGDWVSPFRDYVDRLLPDREVVKKISQSTELPFTRRMSSSS